MKQMVLVLARSRLPIPLCVFVVLSLLVMPVAATGSNPHTLRPGEHVIFQQKIPINVVFVGYDESVIDELGLIDELPEAYEPVVRFSRFYGLSGRDMGLHFDFEYRTVHAGCDFENDFFEYLADAGEPGDLTSFQQDYNDQVNNVLEVTGPVLYLDAPSVEKWLEDRGRERLGIDPEHSYTIYFINWYGHDGFQFHVYTKTDEPDPDTGYNFGEIRDSRKMIAWGGSHGRSWFYDLSAGPEAWTDNWNVDTPDLDGNGIEDYRMPPIWEYTADGYRDPSALSSDLGLVTRFVGINLLFTTSPLYDPLNTTPGLNGRKVVHIEMFEDDPASSGLDWIDPGFIARKLRRFQPYYPWRVRLEDNDPIDPGAERSFRIFAGLLAEDDCWNDFSTPFAQLFCYFNANLDAYVPAYRPNDYVGEVFAFNTTDENMGVHFGLLGFADDDWATGTQTHMFAFDTPMARALGFGFSVTTVHEFGHHIGLSHPHDGYDSELDIDYGPEDGFYFAWSGDESDTVMHYLALSFGFGQFDQDNMYRFETAGYLNQANELLGDILSHPAAGTVSFLLRRADWEARRALRGFERWHYLSAASHAYRAYSLVVHAARNLGIATRAPASLPPPDFRVLTKGDVIRYPDR